MKGALPAGAGNRKDYIPLNESNVKSEIIVESGLTRVKGMGGVS
jgi:hypothetical protein